jgi:hypothetical protein
VAYAWPPVFRPDRNSFVGAASHYLVANSLPLCAYRRFHTCLSEPFQCWGEELDATPYLFSSPIYTASVSKTLPSARSFLNISILYNHMKIKVCLKSLSRVPLDFPKLYAPLFSIQISIHINLQSINQPCSGLLYSLKILFTAEMLNSSNYSNKCPTTVLVLDRAWHVAVHLLTHTQT